MRKEMSNNRRKGGKKDMIEEDKIEERKKKEIKDRKFVFLSLISFFRGREMRHKTEIAFNLWERKQHLII